MNCYSILILKMIFSNSVASTLNSYVTSHNNKKVGLIIRVVLTPAYVLSRPNFMLK